MRRSLTAHCLVAVLIVAAALVGDAVASGSVSAQSGAAPTFSDEPFYTDVPAESDSYEPEGDSGEMGWTEVDPQSESYRHIQSLARAGVFGGTDCGVGRFCPDAHVQRWQLAVWLMRSLGESDLDRIDGSRFADVDADEWWAPYVERMAELGISTSCSGDPLRYCPDEAVSRGELAAFLSQCVGPPGGRASRLHRHRRPHSRRCNQSASRSQAIALVGWDRHRLQPGTIEVLPRKCGNQSSDGCFPLQVA